jgi:leucyl aminopeptidase (aminopeptidase T)
MPVPSIEQADQLARAVLRQRLHLKPKEDVTIEAYPSAIPWATGFVREARRAGARPLLLYEDERSYWTAVEDGRASLLGQPGNHEWAALRNTDVYVYFWGPEDLARRRRLPERTAEQLTAFNSKWYQLARKAELRGARMAIARLTESNARLFGTPLGSWREKVVAASMRDPAQLRSAARRVATRFERGKTVRIRHPNGTDLTLALAGRKANVAIGEVTASTQASTFGSMASVPDATVYVAVDESTADGTFVADRRTSSPSDPPLDGGRFVFRDGRLVRATFRSGGSGFRHDFAAAGEGRDRPSFLEVGLDPALRAVPLLEEAEAGAVTVGVGANAGFGGATRVDFQSYLTLSGATVSVDREPLVRRGKVVGR